MGAALAPVMLVAGLAGAGLSAAGTYGGMEAQSANAAYQAQVSANNARIANQNAAMDIQSGNIKAANSEMKTRAQAGMQLAQQGASGVAVNSPSFAATRKATSAFGMYDAMTMRSSAAKAAYAQEVAATSDTAESQLQSAESSEASDIAPVAALGSFLGGASSVGARYAGYTTGA